MTYPMYQLSMETLPWVSFPPAVNNQSLGQLIVVGSATNRDVSSHLQPGMQFYLKASGSGYSEDQSIVRTCVGSSYNDATRENVFLFTPAPPQDWAVTAYVTIVRSSTPISYTGYRALSPTAAPSTLLVDACITDCLTNNPDASHLAKR